MRRYVLTMTRRKNMTTKTPTQTGADSLDSLARNLWWAGFMAAANAHPHPAVRTMPLGLAFAVCDGLVSVDEAMSSNAQARKAA